MNTSNPIRHVLVALSISAILYVIAGDRWADNIGAIRPVKIVPKAGA